MTIFVETCIPRLTKSAKWEDFSTTLCFVCGLQLPDTAALLPNSSMKENKVILHHFKISFHNQIFSIILPIKWYSP